MSVATDLMVLGTVLDYGDQALLLQFDSTAQVLAWTDALRAADLLGVIDIVRASRTVLINLDGPRYQSVTGQRLGKLRLAPESLDDSLGTAPLTGRADVVIDVVYDGADLEEVARLTGLHTDQVVAAHTGTPWRVGFGGFAPGFAYLVGGDARRARRRRPRQPRVAAPRHLGRVPGGVMTTTLEVLRTGPLALVEDLGRAGLAHLGVTRSGAADRRSHTLANRLVANPGDRATIEVMFGGFTARVRGGDVTIAVTGADTDPAVNGVPCGINSIHYAHHGEVISLGAPHSGLRTYLAVRGGIDVTPVLGSRSYDVMSAIGPLPLQSGDVLPIGEHTDDFPELDQAPVAAIEEDLLELLVVPGPRDGWFTDPGGV